MALKHKTIPAGTDQPGFGGVTPSLYAEEHLFSGGTQGAVLVRNTLNTDGSGWVASVAGVLISTGAAEIPTFSTALPDATQDLITRLGTVTSGSFPAANLSGTTLAATVVTSSLTSVGTIATGVWSGTAISAVKGGTAIDTSGSTGVAQIAAGTWSVSTTLQTAVMNNITRTGTLVAGSTGAGFTLAMSVSTITGTLPDTNLSSNVPLKNASNTFTSGPQIISTAVGSAFINFKESGTQRALIGLSGAIKGTAANDLGFFAENGKGMSWMVNGSTTDAMALSTSANLTVNGTGVSSFAGLVNANAPWTSGIAGGFSVAGWTVMGWDGVAGLTVGGSTAANWTSVKFYTGGTNRFSINSNGDLCKGTNIMDSVGTPTVASGFGAGSATISGTDYAFTLVLGTAGAGTGTISFAHTFTNTPVPVATFGNPVSGAPGGGFVNIEATSTTFITFRYGGTVSAGDRIHVLVRGW